MPLLKNLYLCRSTQSEWVSGQRVKSSKSGLIGKLKKLTRGISSERDSGNGNSNNVFGSGSDISSVSMQSSSRNNGRSRTTVLYSDEKKTHLDNGASLYDVKISLLLLKKIIFFKGCRFRTEQAEQEGPLRPEGR